jgi:hypothetical protein
MNDANTTTNAAPTGASTGATLAIATDVKAAALLTPEGHRLIVQHLRNPARSICVAVPDAPWTALRTAAVPEQYIGLLDAVLDNAAKSILKRYAIAFSLLPSTIPSALLTADAIMTEAAGSASEWLSKDELSAAWETSATRKAFITNPNYAANQAYRAQVNNFAELIKKLAGKTSTYNEQQLDIMQAKIHEDDHMTEFGQFVMRRIEQLRNKKPAEELSFALL